MKIVGYILLACLLLALLRWALFLIVAALLLALLWGAFLRPRETFTLLFALLLFGLAAERPVACIVVAGVVALVLRLRPGGPKLGRSGTEGNDGGAGED